jgi:hypothetical protein
MSKIISLKKKKELLEKFGFERTQLKMLKWDFYTQKDIKFSMNPKTYISYVEMDCCENESDLMELINEVINK